MTVLLKYAALFLIILTPQLATAAETLRHNKINSAKEEYQFGVIKLALSYSSTKYDFIESPVYLSQAKLASDLDSGKVDIAWMGTSSEYEDTFLPIRVPLFKGLLGHRIFLIRRGEQSRFNGIKGTEDLSRFKAGQGASWTDAKIMKQAGLNVVTTAKYNNLFYMLDGGRFDYFPRSIYSPWGEMAKRPELPLQVEKNLILIYPLPAYAFVNSQNVKLKNEVESGLYKAIEDGSFDEYFYNHPMIKEGLNNSNLDQRTILRVNNNMLDKKTPIDDKRLWFSIEDYVKK